MRIWSLPMSSSDLSGAAANGGLFHFANRTCATKNGPALFCLSDGPCSYGPLNYILLPTRVGGSTTRWSPAMSTDFTEQWSNMQKMFLQSSEMSASFRESARRFWENQGKLLDNMQALANGWFDRRRTGTHAGREGAERLCGTQKHFDLTRGIQVVARAVF